MKRFEKTILETLVSAYEKKGGSASVAASGVYREYDSIMEPEENKEWFESDAKALEQKGLVSIQWKGEYIKRIRLNTGALMQAEKELGRSIRVQENGRDLLEGDPLNGMIDRSFYERNPSIYKKERQRVLQLSRYLDEHRPQDMLPVAERERCFQIWQEEKMFSTENGRLILSHCGIAPEQLSVYRTFEPVPYRSFSRKTPQAVLFVENSATYCSILRAAGSAPPVVFGKQFGTVVYGGGDRILGQAGGWTEEYVDKYLTYKENAVFYFGDLDRTGISIFLSLEKLLPLRIVPLKEAYVRMAEKMLEYESREEEKKMMPEKQLMTGISGFERYFEPHEWDIISGILKKGYLVPQEILTAGDMFL